MAATLGKAGSVQPVNVYKVGFPRSDLAVRLDDVQLKPGLALGSWAAFLQLPQHAMVMGDLVLTEDEVNPILFGGIQIRAELQAKKREPVKFAPLKAPVQLPSRLPAHRTRRNVMRSAVETGLYFGFYRDLYDSHSYPWTTEEMVESSKRLCRC